jgi:hypothetical protein
MQFVLKEHGQISRLSVYLGSNLVSALASLEMDDLTHLESLFEED